MARADGFIAAGILSALLCVALAHPPSAPGGTGTRQLQWDRQPWLRLGDEELDGFGPVPDEWSFGFGRRLSLIERRQGPVQQQQQSPPPLSPPEPAIEASTKLITVTRQLRPKPADVPVPGESKPETSSASNRPVRKRLPTNRPATSPLNAPEASAPVVAANVPVNDTARSVVAQVEVDPVDELDVEESITSPTVVEPAALAEEKVEQSSSTTSAASTTTTATTSTTSTTMTSTTTTTTTRAPSTERSSTTVNPTTLVPAKPLWRIRMEQNQNIRRQQLASTVKPDSSESSGPSDVALSTSSVKSTTIEFVPLRAFVPAEVSSVTPSIEPSQVDVTSTLAPSVASTATSAPSAALRPIQSSRISPTSTATTSGTATPAPVTRPHLTTTRVSPSLPPRLIVTTSRQQVAVVPTAEVKSQEAQTDEENSVKDAGLVSGASSSPVAAVTTSTATESTTTTTASTTTRPPSTTTRKPPTPVMHSLEDILQRLVPARDDSYHNNPYLTSPTNHGSGGSRIPVLVPAQEEVNEIVAEVRVNQRSGASAGQRTNSNGTSNSSQANGDASETQQATTSIYIVGIVAIIPLAGVILWVLRVHLHKRRERLNESETSSETGFRKRLPPVALTPSKHARLFYGQPGDKEDLVPGASGQSGSGSGSKMSSGTSSPWEFTRSRLRLQTLIGEGNFGQVWKAEAEDICGCQGTLLVAVKTVKDGATNKEKQELLREMKIMQQLGPHPNVVALLGCCTEQEPFLLIMEYVMYGRLLTFLRDHRTHQTYYNYSSDSEALTSRDLTTFAYCVAKGMEYIYSKGIVHRDLAARNVLVDHNKLCKVADFGLSRNVRDSAGEMYEQRVKGALPIRWMAPESLIQSVFTQKSDVWSFGILVWEIVTLGSTPYPGMEAREVMRRVKDGHRLERPSHCRPEFYRLMSRCWHSDPQRRPDFSELKTELGRLLDDADGYIDLDNFQDSGFPPLESPSDESEKV